MERKNFIKALSISLLMGGSFIVNAMGEMAKVELTSENIFGF